MNMRLFEPSTWRAETYLGRAESGRTRPLRLSCSQHVEENEGTLRQTAEFFAKFNGLPEIFEKRLFAEMIGNVLARDVGILTGEPAFIEIDEPFVTSLRSVEIDVRAGIGVGSRNLGVGVGPPLFGRISDDQLADAARIYLFDLMTQNPDRAVENPNCFVVERRIAAIDFESCFSFLYPILGRPLQPWEVSRIGVAEEHLFRKVLGTSEVDWTHLAGTMLVTASETLNGCERWVPAHWNAWLEEVQEHVAALDSHRHELVFEIVRSLA